VTVARLGLQRSIESSFFPWGRGQGWGARPHSARAATAGDDDGGDDGSGDGGDDDGDEHKTQGPSDVRDQRQ